MIEIPLSIDKILKGDQDKILKGMKIQMRKLFIKMIIL